MGLSADTAGLSTIYPLSSSLRYWFDFCTVAISLFCFRWSGRRNQCALPLHHGQCHVGKCASEMSGAIETALCTTIKNRGIKIAVLYTTYLALPTNRWYNSWIAPFNVGPYGPSPTARLRSTCKAVHRPVSILKLVRRNRGKETDQTVGCSVT
jgi:hypothetical protein